MAQTTRKTLDNSRHAVLISSGDLREEANRVCWPAQQALEYDLGRACTAAGWTLDRGHAPSRSRGHGFIASAREGLDVFETINPQAPLIVAEAVWQYSHHVLPGLTTHKGPILTVANWSGQWPGLAEALAGVAAAVRVCALESAAADRPHGCQQKWFCHRVRNSHTRRSTWLPRGPLAQPWK